MTDIVSYIHNSYLLDLRSSSESVSQLPAKSVNTASPVNLPLGRCNAHLQETRGQFSPPDNPYRSNTDCAWVIEVPHGYKYISLKIYGLQIE